MKKRLLSLAMALMLLLGLLPLGVFAGNATLPLNLLYNTETAQPALKTGVPSTGGVFSTAYVRNRPKSGAANGVARELEVVVKLKQFDSQVHVAAIVMRASDFMAWAPNGPTAAGLVLSNYFSITSSKVDGEREREREREMSGLCREKPLGESLSLGTEYDKYGLSNAKRTWRPDLLIGGIHLG